MKKKNRIIEKAAWMIAILLGTSHFLSSHFNLHDNEQQVVINALSHSYEKISEMVVLLMFKS